jgi:23S rRNA (guanosine2251-2'-O)-methyltransferase
VALRFGIHPVLEALRTGSPLNRVLIARESSASQRLQEIVALCREHSVPVRFERRQVLDRLCGGAAHQGVAALGAAHQYRELEELLETARLLVALDGIEDPHNLGAIIRTAHAAGAAGVVVPERRSAPLTEAVAKAAAGALEYLPVARVGNLNRALETLKQRGFWIYGLDERGEHAYDAIDYALPTVFVLGAEGGGLHQQVRKRCDFLIRIPLAGRIPSLNVSVAAGVVLFEWKQRQAPGA